jgi:glycerol-3-phosphate dehydrogenase (NAD(P)+)
MAKLAVVGAGMMGSALCVPLADRGHEVHLIGTPLDEAIVRELRAGQPHPTLGLPLPAGVRAHSVVELGAVARDAEALILGVSSAGIRWAAAALGPLLHEAARPVLLLSKGLEINAHGVRVLSQAFAANLPSGLGAIAPAAVCGPCIAGELARRVPTVIALTGADDSVLTRFRDWIETPYYHPVLQRDVIGVQVCAALKNAYAMGVGFAAGLHRRAQGERGSVAFHNYEAAVYAQSVLEMQRLVSRLGGQPNTAAGLAGAGDLNVTCNGGRTGRFGELLGFGHSAAEALHLMHGATLECLEVLAVLDRFLARPDARLGRAELPLLWHLIEVALHGHPVAMPFAEFFQA